MLTGIAVEGGCIVREEVGKERCEEVFRGFCVAVIVIVIILILIYE